VDAVGVDVQADRFVALLQQQAQPVSSEARFAEPLPVLFVFAFQQRR
jgi:hypothetical protein